MNKETLTNTLEAYVASERGKRRKRRGGPCPPFVRSDVLGWLRLNEDWYGNRHYAVARPPLFCGREVESVIAWPPEIGVSDPLPFVRFVDGVWTRLARRFDQIARESVPMVEKAISVSHSPTDPERPAAGPMLGLDRLTMIKINATAHPQNKHEIMFSAPEYLGGHDLGIQFDRKLRPLGAYFDG